MHRFRHRLQGAEMDHRGDIILGQRCGTKEMSHHPVRFVEYTYMAILFFNIKLFVK